MAELRKPKVVLDIMVIIICSNILVYCIQYVFNIPLIVSLFLCMLSGFYTLYFTKQYKFFIRIFVLLVCSIFSYSIIKYTYNRYFGARELYYPSIWMDMLYWSHAFSFLLSGIYAFIRNSVKKRSIMDIILFTFSFLFIIFIGTNIRKEFENEGLAITDEIETISNEKREEKYIYEYIHLDALVQDFHAVFRTKAQGINPLLFNLQQDPAVAEALSQAESLDDILDVYQQFNTKN